MSAQTGYKVRILLALMVVFALWACSAIAGVNEDLPRAAGRGDLPAVKNFIDKGADVNAKANTGVTALIMASQQGHKEVVELLLAKGADVNAKANDGGTALIMSSLQGHKEVVELLLAKGADVNAKNHDGCNRIDVCLS